MQVEDRPEVQTINSQGTDIIGSIKKIIHEGNVRKISISHDGETIAEFPLTVGVVGAAIAPALAAIGAIAALVTDCTIQIEKTTA